MVCKFRRLCPLVVIPAFLALTMAGCSNPSSSLINQESATVEAKLAISTTASPVFSKIVKRATVTVTGSDMATVTTPLTVADSSVEGRVSNLPPGKSRRFTVEAFDSNAVVQYSGSAIQDLLAGQTAVLKITLYRAGTSVQIKGTISDAPSDVLAYWSFDTLIDNVAPDVSDHGFNVTLGSLITVAGHKGKALNCDNSTFSLPVPNSKLLSVPQVTVEAWVYSNVALVNSNGNFGYHSIFENDNANSGLEMGYALQFTDTGKLRFAIGTGSWNLADSKDVVSDHAWHHVAGTFDGQTARVYLDGVKVGESVVGGAYTPTDLSAQIGCQNYSSSTRDQFRGFIDELIIYSRALSDAEIAAHALQ